MKRILALLMCILMLTSLNAYATTVEFIIGDTTMAKVQNNTQDRLLETSNLPAAPFIANDRTMVPVRALSESFNCQVGWNSDLREVTITDSDKVVKLYIDSTKAFVNDTEITLDAAPVIVGDITFVPVRFVTENMGYNVQFVPGINSVMVYDQEDYKNADGEAIAFPKVDILNYDLFLMYNDHPATSVNEEYKSFANSLINVYDYFDRYVKDNGLSISPVYAPAPAEYEKAYSSNILKGELSLYYNYLGAEATMGEHLSNIHSDEINELYKKEYTCAKHILVTFETYSEDEALKLAKKIHKEAKNGADFDTLISTYNEDPGMAQNPDGYVFTKGEMVEEFEKTAFSLKPGEISAPVKTVYGYHILLGMELPEISNEIKAGYTTKLYVQPIINKYMPN